VEFTGKDRITICHDLLYSLMTYGDVAKKDENHLPYKVGNWNSWSLAPRGILTWLVSQALNVHRHPWHPDVCQANTPSNEMAETLRLLHEQFDTEGKVQAAIDEICRIYEHTQSVLKRKGLTTVTLSRSFQDEATNSMDEGYASRVAGCSQAAKSIGQSSFKMPSNILTSWCEGSGYSNYPVTITVDHPIENVIWFSDVIASRGENPQSPALESGEWIIINRSLDGLISIPTNSVMVKNWDRVKPQLESAYLADYGYIRNELRSDHEKAQRYLDSNSRQLEPLQGFAYPHYHPAKLPLSWAKRVALTWETYRRLGRR
jgi:hypothetical protein